MSDDLGEAETSHKGGMLSRSSILECSQEELSSALLPKRYDRVEDRICPEVYHQRVLLTADTRQSEIGGIEHR